MGQTSKRPKITSNTADYEKLLAILELKPEQKRAMFVKIQGELDAGQRKALVAHYRDAK